ncbi:hypothetical protein FQA39_LY19005 [Lamprigera yunnana]|nr:hypothetical protein FQA39_LY19005 [Lamprigera yunnana]
MADDGALAIMNSSVSVAEIAASLQTFNWLDYVVFVCMLIICVCIGIYFGFINSSTNTTEYLMGGRSMETFPVAISLMASFISGISLLGIPTEIYVYGTQYLAILGGVVLMALMFQIIFLPIFHNLQITSTYEYLERRFDKKTRIFGSMLFSIGIITWLPIVIYVPALAFNQVTGVNVHLITPIVCIICIFYTTIGGLKAVVWTDVVQTAFMVCAILLVATKGTYDVGGLHVVLGRNWKGNRIDNPNFDLDPFSRHTVWGLTIGGSIYWLHATAVNQNMIQRYLSLPSFKSSRRALWIFVVGIFFLLITCSYCGMLTYATYHNCDPLTTTLAKEKDQLLPLLVMKVLGEYSGLPGLFVAGVFSAALSSLSTSLNSMAAVVLEDFYKPLFSKNISERHTNIVMKSTTVLVGSICVGLVFVVEKLGTVLQLSVTVNSITAGPSLALFVMGALMPWVTSKGALVGGVSGLVLMLWLCVRAQSEIAAGALLFLEKPFNTDGCDYHFTPKAVVTNFTLIGGEISEKPFSLYRISYLWYTLLGASFTTLVGLLTSLLTKPLDPKDVDKLLLAPFIRRLIPERHFPNQPSSDEIIYAFVSNKNQVKHIDPSYKFSKISQCTI